VIHSSSSQVAGMLAVPRAVKGSRCKSGAVPPL
jgi:hypothetical protein